MRRICIYLALLTFLTLITVGTTAVLPKVAYANSSTPNSAICQHTYSVQQAYAVNSAGEWYAEVWLYGLFDSQTGDYCGQMYGRYHVAHRQTPPHGSTLTWDEHFTSDSSSHSKSGQTSDSNYSYFGSNPPTSTTCAEESVMLSPSSGSNTLVDTGLNCISSSAQASRGSR